MEGTQSKIVASIDRKSLTSYITKQCNLFFPDNHPTEEGRVDEAVATAIDRLEYCFSRIITPYYKKDGRPYFNHLHGDHYSMFLYLLSNTAYKQLKDEQMASKLFMLNKMLFGVDAFYAVELPEIFMFVHPIGTILGKAVYKDYFVTYQGVTIGATTDLIYPAFSENTILYSNSSIIGRCNTGKGFILGAKASLINTDVGDNKIVVGNYPTHRIIENKNNLIGKYFSV